jgi:formate dehydrogenase subunit gamma
VAVGEATARADTAEQANPRANYWRAVRDGVSGYTAVDTPEAGVLIQNGGENWRSIRNGPVVAYGAGLMGVFLLALILFHFIAGPARLAKGRSGQKIYRWSVFERVVHWFVAILFIILAITGLSLLYGRAVLIPIMGPAGFAAYAELAKVVHNYLGVFLSVGLVVMLLMWIKESLFTRVDWAWIKQGGGYLGSGHPHAGRVNAGEKIWFWVLFFAGIGLIVSGLTLNFPNLGFDRFTMQAANVIHGVLGIVLVAFAFGHIYLGTFGNEGTFEGMVTGYVDKNWALQHHDLSYEEVKGEGGVAREAAPARQGRVAGERTG